MEITTIITHVGCERCANKFVEQHGRSGVIRAGERIADVSEKDDRAGTETRLLILERIVKRLKEPNADDQMH